MKHKVIITSQGKVVVDELAGIKEGEWYVDDSNQIRQSITSDKYYWSQRVDYCKIVATLNFSIDKDIPMIIVEDEVEIGNIETAKLIDFIEQGNKITTNNEVIYSIPQEIVQRNKKWFLRFPTQQKGGYSDQVNTRNIIYLVTNETLMRIEGTAFHKLEDAIKECDKLSLNNEHNKYLVVELEVK